MLFSVTKDEQSSHTARCPSSQPSSSGVQAQRGSHKTGHSDPGVLGLAQTHVCTICRHGSIRRGSFINQAGNHSGRKHTVSEMGEETGILCEKKKHLEGSYYITITNDWQNFRFKTVAAMCIFLPFPPPWANTISRRVKECWHVEKRKGRYTEKAATEERIYRPRNPDDTEHSETQCEGGGVTLTGSATGPLAAPCLCAVQPAGLSSPQPWPRNHQRKWQCTWKHQVTMQKYNN